MLDILNEIQSSSNNTSSSHARSVLYNFNKNLLFGETSDKGDGYVGFVDVNNNHFSVTEGNHDMSGVVNNSLTYNVNAMIPKVDHNDNYYDDDDKQDRDNEKQDDNVDEQHDIAKQNNDFDKFDDFLQLDNIDTLDDDFDMQNDDVNKRDDDVDKQYDGSNSNTQSDDVDKQGDDSNNIDVLAIVKTGISEVRD